MLVRPISSVAELLSVMSLGHRRRDRSNGARGSVDELDHALQAAHEAYLVRPSDEELHVAGLVHDIGQLTVPPGAVAPRDVPLRGAASVIGLLGARVARIVALQGDAFRYLATEDEEFATTLRPDSRARLLQLGGAMTPAEARRFERISGFADAVVLAAVDDLAREAIRTVPSLISWRPVLESVARAAASERAADRILGTRVPT